MVRIFKMLCRILIVIVLVYCLGYFVGYVCEFAVDKLYPMKDTDIIEKYCAEYSLEPALVCALIHAESKFDNDAVSNKEANGYMQIIEQTAIWGADEIGIDGFSYDDIHDPELNIRIGTWYIRTLLDQFGDEKTALAAYNAGSGTVSKWLKNPEYSADGKVLDVIPYKETENYIKRIEFNKKIYEIRLKHGL